MLKIFSALFASLLVHYIILYYSAHPLPTSKKIKSKESLIVRLRYKKKKKKALTDKEKRNKFTLSTLASAYKVGEYKQYLVQGLAKLDIQKKLTLYTLIKSHLTYPQIFAKHDIKGVVHAIITITKEGRYLEQQSIIKSNSPYLKVHTARLFRKILTPKYLKFLKIKSHQKVPVIFVFHLSPSSRDQHLSNTYQNQYFFYLHRYGTTTPADKVAHIFNKILSYMTNWATIINDLPDSEQTKVKKIWQLEHYRKDPSW